MYTEEELIKECRKGNKKAQEHLYKRYSSKMRYVCLRFARTNFELEDIYQDSFLKVFSNINAFKGQGSLEGWVRRIFVNTAIDYYKNYSRNAPTNFLEGQNDPDEYPIVDEQDSELQNISHEELLEMIKQLPDGYRMVFNLYAIESYSHRDIAYLLKISEGTSKSQLYKARAFLRKMLGEYVIEKNKKVISINFNKVAMQ